MKDLLVLLALMGTLCTAQAQNTYRHAIGAGFGNYLTYEVFGNDVFQELTSPFYGFSAGAEYIFRPGSRFALNSKVEYVSFASDLKVTDELRWGNQFTPFGYNPSIDPGESVHYPIKNIDRIGALAVTVVPNIYVVTGKKVDVYVLAGFSYQRNLHLKSRTNQDGNVTYRTTIPDDLGRVDDANDLAALAGVGIEHICGSNHVMRWEPVFRIADITNWGTKDHSFQSRNLYAGVNMLFAFGFSKTAQE